MYPYYFDLEELLQNGVSLLTSSSLLNVAIAAFTIVVNYLVLEKAGERGWKSLIPFYRGYLEYKLYWVSGLYWVNLVMPLVAIILFIIGAVIYDNFALAAVLFVIGFMLLIACIAFKVILQIKKGKCFGESAGFGVGLILLNTIFCAILAFDKKCIYVGNVNKQEETTDQNRENTENQE